MRQPERSAEVPGLKRDADGKYTEPIGSGRDPLHVFTVIRDVDGRPAIRISGEVFGELRTSRVFKDYHLKLQFKWGSRKWAPRDKPGTPRDSGLLYHVHAPPGAEGRTWARSIELQIQEHDVGDLYAIGSVIAVRARPRAGTALYDYDPGGEWTFFSQSQGASGRCVKQPDNEKPTGEWNSVELVAFGEDAIHIVNGTVVMRLHGPLRIDGDVPAPGRPVKAITPAPRFSRRSLFEILLAAMAVVTTSCMTPMPPETYGLSADRRRTPNRPRLPPPATTTLAMNVVTLFSPYGPWLPKKLGAYMASSSNPSGSNRDSQPRSTMKSARPCAEGLPNTTPSDGAM